jgi:hypothetical protein
MWMIKQIAQAAFLAACGLALSGCIDQPKPTVAAKRAPAGDYQMAAAPVPPPSNIRAICFNEADLATFRVRALKEQLTVGTLQCQAAGGRRIYEGQYTDFLNKFGSQLSQNGRELQSLTARKRRNMDQLVTELANRTAQRAPTDLEFCSRQLRAFEWALSPQVTTMGQVPPPYDLGPDMSVFPCPAQ